MWAGGSRCSAVIGIVYGAAVALRQSDFKFVIGYSSVSHMGFVLLGPDDGQRARRLRRGAANVFPRRHRRPALRRGRTHDLSPHAHARSERLSRMHLSRTLPFAAFAFVVASAASMGIPGFSGFAAEITILLGAWKTFPVAVGITGIGMVLVAAFTLRALKKHSLRRSRPFVQQGRVAVDSDWNEQLRSPSTHYLRGKTGSLSADLGHARGRTLSQTPARPDHAGG